MSLIRHFAMMPLLFLAAHAVAQRPSVCLTLHLMGTDNAPVTWGAAHQPPDTIAIDSAAFFSRNGASFVIRPMQDALQRTGRGQLIRDSLFMGWFGGIAGVALRGSLQDSTYRGVATVLSDVLGGTPAQARVQGLRVQCPARLR